MVQLYQISSGFEVSNSTDHNITVTCNREHEYDSMDIREVLGQWRVVELYLHLSKEGVNMYKSCPFIKIWTMEDFPTTTFGVGLC